MTRSATATPVAPVRVSVATLQMAREEAAVSGRSLSGQVDYWARLGRAVEASPTFSRERVNAALRGEFDAEKLNDGETEAFEAEAFQAMAKLQTPSSIAFYKKLATRPGVGVDDAGRLVRLYADGRIEVLPESV